MSLPEGIKELEFRKFAEDPKGKVAVNTVGNVIITPSDGSVIDAFGRLRVSNPVTLFDSKNIYDDPDIPSDEENIPLFFDNQEVSGSGTSTEYSPYKSEQRINVSANTAGMRVRQTKMRFNYQPGKSQLAILSYNLDGRVDGLTKREGIFDENNGLFLELSNDVYVVQRSNATGSVVDTKTAQSEWNIDKMDGTGPSGVVIDLSKTQILFIDYEWLGVGRVRFGFVVNGIAYYVHEFNNANDLDFAYMNTPNLPIRSEISNDGTGPAGSISQICSTVISEGGSKDLGTIKYTSTSGTHLNANTENTAYALIAIRLKDNYKGASINLLNIALQIQNASKRCEWFIAFNPVVSGSLNFVDVPNSAIQRALGTTSNTVSGGTLITGGFIESTGNPGGGAGGVSEGIDTALRLGNTIAGVSDVMVLCVRPVGGSTGVDVEGSISWRELN